MSKLKPDYREVLLLLLSRGTVPRMWDAGRVRSEGAVRTLQHRALVVYARSSTAWASFALRACVG